MKLSWPQAPRHWVYLAAVAIVVVLIAVPLIELAPYFEITSSSAKLSLTSQYLVGRFNFATSDQANLNQLTSRLNLNWRGQDFAATVGADSPLKQWLPVDLGLVVPDPTTVTVTSSNVKLPPGPPGLTNEGLAYLPATTVAVIRATKIQQAYQLDGKDVFNHTAARGTVGVTLTDKLGLVFVDQVTDQAGLTKALAGLKDIQVKPSAGYSGSEAAAAGFSQQQIAGVTVYTLNQPGLAYQPTFGELGGNLVVTSSPELWQQVQASYATHSGFSATANYRQIEASLPAWSSGSIYLDLRALAGRGVKLQDDLAPLFKLNLAPQLLSYGIDAGKLHLLTAAWFSLSNAPTPVPSRMVAHLSLR